MHQEIDQLEEFVEEGDTLSSVAKVGESATKAKNGAVQYEPNRTQTIIININGGVKDAHLKPRDEENVGKPIIIENKTQLDGETIYESVKKYNQQEDYKKTGSSVSGGYSR